jgi:colanic acid biosynthesis glycosyl transferase WcaI
MLMRLLMIVPYYAPDLGPSAPLFTMLAEELVKRGHQVTVIAAVPHYPSGTVPEEFRKKLIQRSKENGVEVIRVRVPSVKRASLWRRILQYVCYQFGATWAGLGLHYDAAFVANPALWVLLPYTCLVFFRRKPSIFSVHDVYPDVGITLGIFRNKFVSAAVGSLERFCLKYSFSIRILSESFKPGVQALGVPESKLVLIYDWVDTTLIKPLPKDNSFTQEYLLKEKFVVLYAGNLGLSQGLEHVLIAADRLADHADLQFVFVGDGAGKELLFAQVEQKKLKNVQLIPFQPRQRLPEVLASADIALISLKKGVGTGSLPSKTFSSMASGRPVIACVDEGSETWNLIQRAEAGLCVPPENPAELSNTIIALKRDPALRERLGRNGRVWAEQHHSPQAAAEKFERLFEAVIEKDKSSLQKVNYDPRNVR